MARIMEGDLHADNLRKVQAINWLVESGWGINLDNPSKIVFFKKDPLTNTIKSVNIKAGYMNAKEIANIMNQSDFLFNQQALVVEKKNAGEGVIKRLEDWSVAPMTTNASANGLVSQNGDDELFVNSLLNAMSEEERKSYQNLMNYNAYHLINYLYKNKNFDKEVYDELTARWTDEKIYQQIGIDASSTGHLESEIQNPSREA